MKRGGLNIEQLHTIADPWKPPDFSADGEKLARHRMAYSDIQCFSMFFIFFHVCVCVQESCHRMNHTLLSVVGTVVSKTQDLAKPRPGVYEGPALLVLAPDSPELLGWLLVIKEVMVVEFQHISIIMVPSMVANLP